MSLSHINPVQWNQAIGVARQTCARIFRDGGAPIDAVRAFGILEPAQSERLDWGKAVDLVATALCAEPLRRAA